MSDTDPLAEMMGDAPEATTTTGPNADAPEATTTLGDFEIPPATGEPVKGTAEDILPGPNVTFTGDEPGPEVFDPATGGGGEIIPKTTLNEGEQAIADAPSSQDTPGLDGPDPMETAGSIAAEIMAPKTALDNLPAGVERDSASIEKAFSDRMAEKKAMQREMAKIDDDLRKLGNAKRAAGKAATPLHKLNESARILGRQEEEQRREERALLAKYLGRRRHRGARDSTNRPMPPGFKG